MKLSLILSTLTLLGLLAMTPAQAADMCPNNTDSAPLSVAALPCGLPGSSYTANETQTHTTDGSSQTTHQHNHSLAQNWSYVNIMLPEGSLQLTLSNSGNRTIDLTALYPTGCNTQTRPRQQQASLAIGPNQTKTLSVDTDCSYQLIKTKWPEQDANTFGVLNLSLQNTSEDSPAQLTISR